MSTDFQSARVVLGARLRELRTEAGLDGKGVDEALGWQRSKVSRLETGKQTPTAADLTEWAGAVGRPDLAAELKGRLVGLETQYRSWRRQLAGGHRARQELAIAETMGTKVIRGVEVGCSRPRTRPARVRFERRVPPRSNARPSSGRPHGRPLWIASARRAAARSPAWLTGAGSAR